LRFRFLSVALEELTSAADYYREISPALSQEFFKEIEVTIGRIIAHPFAWQKLSARTRRCRLARFPYGLVYRVTPGQILIIAVMHLHQSRWSMGKSLEEHRAFTPLPERSSSRQITFHFSPLTFAPISPCGCLTPVG
jgi:toxin ParE2